VKKIGNVVLGVITSIGGFVEVGSISTSMQAGADFGLQLLWAVALAAFIMAILIEMSGRMAALSGRSLIAAVRDRFGVHVLLTILVAELVIDLLLATAELGGAAIAWRLLTGVAFSWWVLPICAAAAVLLWAGTFGVVENGLGMVGLITLVFVWAAWKLGPGGDALRAGLIPSLPDHDPARYAFIAVGIVGATASPYLLNFYASGAVEEKWSEGDLWSNRITAFLGIGFGAVVSMGALVVAALVLRPRGIHVDSYEQAAFSFVPVFGRRGVLLFAAALLVGCFGAAVEITLNAGYLFAQAFGWAWGANKHRRDTARFTAAMTLVLVAAGLCAVCGFDPLRLTLVAVGLTVILMPVVVLPFLVLMNDGRFVKHHPSGPIGNALLAALTIAAAVMALVVVPLEILGG
jgi:Mn2+/Fe2+ NRAMP family transporter